MPATNVSQDTGYPDRCLLLMSARTRIPWQKPVSNASQDTGYPDMCLLLMSTGQGYHDRCLFQMSARTQVTLTDACYKCQPGHRLPWQMPAPNVSHNTDYPDRCLLQMPARTQATLTDACFCQPGHKLPWQMPASNVSQVAGYTDWYSFLGFPESFQGNAGLESRSRQRPPPSESFPIIHSVTRS